METEHTNTTHEIIAQDQLIREMHEDMRKAKNYMKWQLIITIGLVVIPLLASLFIIPYTLKSLTSSYGLGAATEAGISAETLQELLK